MEPPIFVGPTYHLVGPVPLYVSPFPFQLVGRHSHIQSNESVLYDGPGDS